MESSGSGTNGEREGDGEPPPSARRLCADLGRECRSLTNFVGNTVAAIVIARWEGEIDGNQLNVASKGQA